MRLLTAILVAALPVFGAVGQDKGKEQAKVNEWGKGIPFTLSWADAIKEVQKTGRMLWVYNGSATPGR